MQYESLLAILKRRRLIMPNTLYLISPSTSIEDPKDEIWPRRGRLVVLGLRRLT